MAEAIAAFHQNNIIGSAVASAYKNGTKLSVKFDILPKGKHGFHIHTSGDLREKDCAGACSHWHKGKQCEHGAAPTHNKTRKQRHTGDLGNIQGPGPYKNSYFLKGVKPQELWGRTLIVHEDEDDLGLGDYPDSKTTGHSGKRIGCAIFGRGASCMKNIRNKTIKK
jgi:Cu-Zn family superoxide dismutase